MAEVAALIRNDKFGGAQSCAGFRTSRGFGGSRLVCRAVGKPYNGSRINPGLVSSRTRRSSCPSFNGHSKTEPPHEEENILSDSTHSSSGILKRTGPTVHPRQPLKGVRGRSLCKSLRTGCAPWIKGS